MKLNPRCLRDVLSAIEEIAQDGTTNYEYSSFGEFCEKYSPLEDYPINEVEYHCHQLEMSGCIYGCQFSSDDGISFIDLTPAGHKLLNELRVPSVLKAVEKLISLTGSAAISQIAECASAVFKNQLPNLLDK